jgi:CrcB protein
MTPGRRPAPGVFLLAEAERVKGELVRILLLIVFGTAGTLARYGLQGLVQKHTESTFPTGTLVVNLMGCFLLGGIAQYALTHLTISPEWRIGITTGFFGAFTTFSTFSFEMVRMLEDGEWTRAGIYLAVSVIGGLAGVFLGMRIAERI